MKLFIGLIFVITTQVSLASTTLTIGTHENITIQLERKIIKSKTILVLTYRDKKNNIFKRALDKETFIDLQDNINKIKNNYLIAPFKPCGDVAVLKVENKISKLCFDNTNKTNIISLLKKVRPPNL